MFVGSTKNILLPVRLDLLSSSTNCAASSRLNTGCIQIIFLNMVMMPIIAVLVNREVSNINYVRFVVYIAI